MSSPNVHKVAIMLHELGLPYRFRYVRLTAEEQFTPDFLAMNPLGKVPVLVDEAPRSGESQTVFESGAILFYLAEREGRFLPEAGPERTEVMKWLMVQMANVGPIFGQLTHFLRFAPDGNDYSKSRFYTFAGRIYDMLDRRLSEQAYLAGDTYSIADIATYPWVSLYHETHGMSWDDHPHLRAWCDELGARPAVKIADELYHARMRDEPAREPGANEQGVARVFGWGEFARP
jgi:GST-like protein